MLQNGKTKDLEEQRNENIYFSAQDKLLQNGTENKVDEFLKANQRSHDLFNNTLLEDEALIIIENNDIKFKDRQTMY
jgi:hypothetical protein